MQNDLGITIAITIIAGAFGGIVSYYGLSSGWQRRLDRRRTGNDTPPDDEKLIAKIDGTDLYLYQPMLRGIGAALLVPLLLALLNKEIAEGIVGSSPLPISEANYFVYGGLCLAASISSRAFISSISQRIITMVETAAKTAAQASRRAEANSVALEAQGAQVRSDLRRIVRSSPEVAQSLLGTPRGGRSDAHHIVAPDAVAPDVQYWSDPNKGAFGGQSARDGWELRASVDHGNGSMLLFDLLIEVVAAPDATITDNEVLFHLHPTFPSPVVAVPLVDRRAQLRLPALGAFTVGVEANGGGIRLELDLAQLPGAPKDFRER